ncbi:glycosyltransferase [Phycicoccus flavus]|uniref:Glycosyltransferase n=1 Tax=Phycicoccus flavus TaxID=2502783 RepID=A0A8T6R1J3_9MICO|nr:glycosyltransferase [Phycicoccus flavus]NHA67503.1 glycosyltransferase [Phycicoccus flavus]
MRRLRVLVVAPVLPHEDTPHAGGRYVLALERELRQHADVVLLTRNTPSTREAEPARRTLGLPYAMARRARSPVVGALRRLGALVDDHLTRRDPGAASVTFVAEVLTDPRLRDLVRTADVVDLQWDEMVRLLPVLRLLNRGARFVGTYHDVQSQRFERLAASAPDPGDRDRYARGGRTARRREARLPARLHRVLTFSDKDADLLRSARPEARVTVVRPPLDGTRGRRTQDRDDTTDRSVGFVGYLARAENEDGLRWFLDEVWPLVRAGVPDATLTVAGAGASDALGSAVAAAEGVSLEGFVPDLEAFWAGRAAAVVPLRQGAGVKFKTVESLVAGVPTVATGVGAEGVGPAEWFAAVVDDAGTMATELVRVLRDPSGARGRAAARAADVARAFSSETFSTTVREVYVEDGRESRVSAAGPP